MIILFIFWVLNPVVSAFLIGALFLVIYYLSRFTGNQSEFRPYQVAAIGIRSHLVLRRAERERRGDTAVVGTTIINVGVPTEFSRLASPSCLVLFLLLWILFTLRFGHSTQNAFISVSSQVPWNRALEVDSFKVFLHYSFGELLNNITTIYSIAPQKKDKKVLESREGGYQLTLLKRR